MAAINFVVGIIYLGIAFAFKDNIPSHTYIVWYVFGGLELLANLGLSLVFQVLSFEGTHLTSRMRLLTYIIIGEGIIVLCKNITTIVKNADSWSE
jgi:low temperature requirement protein LtrA